MAKGKSKVPAVPAAPGEGNLDSKFDPEPASTPKPAPKPARAKRPSTMKEDKTFLHLTDAYKIRVKPDSGYRALIRLMGKEGKFAQAVELMGRPDFDPKNGAQAKALLDMIMVRKDAVEQILRSGEDWSAHAKTKTNQLQRRVKDGNSKAKATLSNRKRVKDGVWVGDVQEIISVCCGAWENDNRNVSKFDHGGVTFRKYPLKPKRDDPVFLMMFPAKYASAVIRALRAVFGNNLNKKEGELPDKFKG